MGFWTVPEILIVWTGWSGTYPRETHGLCQMKYVYVKYMTRFQGRWVHFVGFPQVEITRKCDSKQSIYDGQKKKKKKKLRNEK